MSVRALVDRVLASRTELDDARERAATHEAGCTLVADVPRRARARVAGVLRSVTIHPRAGHRALAAELYDGSGVVTLVFLGRRDISGIEAGRHLRAEGLVADVDGERVIFNPRYELRAAA